MNDTASKDGGPAFPTEQNTEHFSPPSTIYHSGMTLRDYFAAMSMQGILAQSLGTVGGADPIHAATLAYNHADAMLQARQS